MLLLGKKPKPFDPVLTFVPEVQEFLIDEYSRAGTILEYGSGGSTALAARLGKRTVSVESDKKWAREMNAFLKANHPEAPVTVKHVDVGKTGAWGRPVNDADFKNYHKYSLAVWDKAGFVQPDLILVDGRFRVACFCAALMRIERPTRLLFDDYHDRTHYHVVEKICAPVRMVAKMAVFDLLPGQITAKHWTWIVGSFVNTN